MIVYQDVSISIREKCAHVRKIGGKLRGGFGVFNGDIPVAHFNETTKKLEPVENLGLVLLVVIQH